MYDFWLESGGVPIPGSRNEKPQDGPLTLNPEAAPQNRKRSTLNPQRSTPNPQPSTLNPHRSSLSPQPSTLNAERWSRKEAAGAAGRAESASVAYSESFESAPTPYTRDPRTENPRLKPETRNPLP